MRRSSQRSELVSKKFWDLAQHFWWNLFLHTLHVMLGCGEDFLQVVQQFWSWVVRQLLPLAVIKVWHISVVSGRQMNSLHHGPRETLSDWTIGYHPGKGDWCRMASFVGNHCVCSSVGVQIAR